ncbi:hypothetical protein BTK96_006416, partial [Burkholderia pyrrocinia]|nr:hypothetical protein [Burkholderia pyrrocinia]
MPTTRHAHRTTPARRYAWLAALTLALRAGTAGAQPAPELPPSAAPEPGVLYLDVSINGEPTRRIARFR